MMHHHVVTDVNREVIWIALTDSEAEHVRWPKVFDPPVCYHLKTLALVEGSNQVVIVGAPVMGPRIVSDLDPEVVVEEFPHMREAIRDAGQERPME